jgi:ABC-type glycerol-3-phosphate transport system substrate-binding protein
LAKISLIGEGAKALYEASHVLPAYKPLLDEIKNQPSEYFGGQMINQLWLEIAADTPPVTFGYGFDETGSIVATHLQDLLDGKASPEQAMQAAATEIRDKFKKG